MQVLTATDVANALPYGELIDALDAAFAANPTTPPRTHLDVPVANESDATLLLMPAWQSEAGIGVKIATVFPDNRTRGLPAVQASYFLMDANSGVPVAFLDGTELTVRRTAAASALASRYLSRPDAKSLLIIGTGNLAPHLVHAHASARSIERVLVWGRRTDAAQALRDKLAGDFPDVSVVPNLEEAVSAVDIVSSATLASEPLLKGEWLQEGQHIDLVGAFKPTMREADSDAITRCRLFVDTRTGAFAEAGEIVQALEAGAIAQTDIVGELSELARGAVGGRNDNCELTLFKSVGASLEDLAAAALAVRNHR